MTDLEKRTVEIQPTSLENKPVDKKVSVEDLHETIKTFYRLSVDETIKYKEGVDLEKNKQGTIYSIFQDLMLATLDEHNIDTQDKVLKSNYLMNKKIVRDLLSTTVILLRHYSQNDTNLKIMALGKLLQSLQDGKRQSFE